MVPIKGFSQILLASRNQTALPLFNWLRISIHRFSSRFKRSWSMFKRSLLASWLQRPQSSRRPGSVRLVVEELEGRRLPSVTSVAAPPPSDPHADDLKADMAAAARVETRLDYVQAAIVVDKKDVAKDTHDLKVDTRQAAALEANLDKVKADIVKDVSATPVDWNRPQGGRGESRRPRGQARQGAARHRRDNYDLKRDTAALEANTDRATNLKSFLDAINDDIAADKTGGDDSATDAALAAKVKAILDATHADITADEKEVDQDAADFKADRDKANDLESQVDAAWTDVKNDIKSGDSKDLQADLEKVADLQTKLTGARVDEASDKRHLDHDKRDLKADQTVAGELESYLDIIQADIAAS